MVGLAALVWPDKEGDETKATGLVLLVIAQLFTGGLFISEEKILSDYYLDPMMVVGFEGLWGIIYWCILLPIFQ